MRSRLRRRSKVILSVSGDGLRFSFSNRARMNRSMGLAGQRLFFVSGGWGRTGDLNAQCWVDNCELPADGQSAPLRFAGAGSGGAPGAAGAELPITEINISGNKGTKLRDGDLSVVCMSVIYACFGRSVETQRMDKTGPARMMHQGLLTAAPDLRTPEIGVRLIPACTKSLASERAVRCWWKRRLNSDDCRERFSHSHLLISSTRGRVAHPKPGKTKTENST